MVSRLPRLRLGTAAMPRPSQGEQRGAVSVLRTDNSVRRKQAGDLRRDTDVIEVKPQQQLRG